MIQGPQVTSCACMCANIRMWGRLVHFDCVDHLTILQCLLSLKVSPCSHDAVDLLGSSSGIAIFRPSFASSSALSFPLWWGCLALHGWHPHAHCFGLCCLACSGPRLGLLAGALSLLSTCECTHATVVVAPAWARTSRMAWTF